MHAASIFSAQFPHANQRFQAATSVADFASLSLRACTPSVPPRSTPRRLMPTAIGTFRGPIVWHIAIARSRRARGSWRDRRDDLEKYKDRRHGDRGSDSPEPEAPDPACRAACRYAQSQSRPARPSESESSPRQRLQNSRQRRRLDISRPNTHLATPRAQEIGVELVTSSDLGDRCPFLKALINDPALLVPSPGSTSALARRKITVIANRHQRWCPSSG